MPSSKQTYIKPDQVADLLTASPKRDDFLVIDVRSSDFPGGNLPGALNLTTREFGSPDKIERVINDHIAPRPNLSKVIVHCMRSQTRGPYVAHLLSHSPALPPSVEVVILEGGFQGWYRRFRGRRELFENLYGEVEDGVAGGTGEGREAAGPGWKTGKGKGEWEDVVNAREGDVGEAQDSRELRERLGRA
ncbi:hypothetical protein JCM1840_000492 [Sporobolomyces johnsonii]